MNIQKKVEEIKEFLNSEHTEQEIADFLGSAADEIYCEIDHQQDLFTAPIVLGFSENSSDMHVGKDLLSSGIAFEDGFDPDFWYSVENNIIDTVYSYDDFLNESITIKSLIFHLNCAVKVREYCESQELPVGEEVDSWGLYFSRNNFQEATDQGFETVCSLMTRVYGQAIGKAQREAFQE